MPTVNFVEMCILALMAMKPNKLTIEQSFNEQNRNIISWLDLVNPTNDKDNTK